MNITKSLSLALLATALASTASISAMDAEFAPLNLMSAKIKGSEYKANAKLPRHGRLAGQDTDALLMGFDAVDYTTYINLAKADMKVSVAALLDAIDGVAGGNAAIFEGGLAYAGGTCADGNKQTILTKINAMIDALTHVSIDAATQAAAAGGKPALAAPANGSMAALAATQQAITLAISDELNTFFDALMGGHANRGNNMVLVAHAGNLAAAGLTGGARTALAFENAILARISR